MRLLLAAVALLVGMSGAARADDFPCVSTTFNLLSPNDKVCISDFDDPAVPGVTCCNAAWSNGLKSLPLPKTAQPEKTMAASARIMVRRVFRIGSQPLSWIVHGYR